MSLVVWFPIVPGSRVPHYPWSSGSSCLLVLWSLYSPWFFGPPLSLWFSVPFFSLVLWSPILSLVPGSHYCPWSPMSPGSVVPLLSLVLWSSFCPWYLWSPYCPCSPGPPIVLGSFGPLDVPELTCKKLIFLLYTKSIVGSMVYIPVVLIPVSSVYILLNYQEQEKEV